MYQRCVQLLRSWQCTVMLLLGHLFCMILLLPWPSLTCSGLPSCYEMKKTLCALFCCWTREWKRWHVGTPKTCISLTLVVDTALSWNAHLLHPRTGSGDLEQKPLPSLHISHWGCCQQAASESKSGVLLRSHWHPRVSRRCAYLTHQKQESKYNALMCHYLHFK